MRSIQRAPRTLVGLAALLVLAGGPPLRAQSPRAVTVEEVRRVVQAVPPAHPRLLADEAGFQRLKERVQRDAEARELYRVIRAQAEGMLEIPPVRHIVTGRRLLNESRKALRRILTLSLAYRIDGDERFLERAKREMLAAASFPDWNPSHFLDTAEMSLAVAIGYDWLYDELGAQERATIARALREKGIDAGFRHTGWVQARNNWGQVCHAGMTAAALALLEDDRDLATRVVHRAVTNVPYAMSAYAPDGTYPEGPGYWNYGTTFNVVLIAELEAALGTDFGLAKEPGFDRTAEYINHATGPTRLFFNYADGSEVRTALPALQWFAGRYQRPDWLIFENRILKDYLASTAAREVVEHGTSGWGIERLLPLALVWMTEDPRAADIEMGRHWRARGEIPVAMHRTSWTDPNASYFGVKAGTASANHGQMDAGSFVFDAEGVRWAVDLGNEDYHRIESRGMNLWDRAQDSDRWTVFRNNSLSHSTLVIDGQLQEVTGHAAIVKHSEAPSFPHTVVDLSEVYQGQASRVLRGIGLLDSAGLVVQDRLEGVAGKPVRWGMVTRADVEIRGPREAVLRQGGKHLTLRVVQPTDARLQLSDLATPPAEWDSPNPGTRMIGFTVTAAGGAPLELVVLLTPGGAGTGVGEAFRVKPLAQW